MESELFQIPYLDRVMTHALHNQSEVDKTVCKKAVSSEEHLFPVFFIGLLNLCPGSKPNLIKFAQIFHVGKAKLGFLLSQFHVKGLKLVKSFGLEASLSI